jgi:hypothetical protein
MRYPAHQMTKAKRIRGTPSHGTQSKDGEGHKIEIDPSPIGRDHENFCKRDLRSRGSLQEIPQKRAGSSGAPLRCPVATNEPAVEISAKDRDEPVVLNLPEANGW